jgi:hypothetical protein
MIIVTTIDIRLFDHICIVLSPQNTPVHIHLHIRHFVL